MILLDFMNELNTNSDFSFDSDWCSSYFITLTTESLHFYIINLFWLFFFSICKLNKHQNCKISSRFSLTEKWIPCILFIFILFCNIWIANVTQLKLLALFSDILILNLKGKQNTANFKGFGWTWLSDWVLTHISLMKWYFTVESSVRRTLLFSAGQWEMCEIGSEVNQRPGRVDLPGKKPLFSSRACSRTSGGRASAAGALF